MSDELLSLDQVRQLADLINDTGYLPLSDKALRLISTGEHLSQKHQLPSLDYFQQSRADLTAKGYLSKSKGQELANEVEQLCQTFA